VQYLSQPALEAVFLRVPPQFFIEESTMQSVPDSTLPATCSAVNDAVLHLICGKIASGKSTLANQLAQAPATILISEDRWLAGLFPSQIQTLNDYARCANNLRGIMQDHIASILRAGTSVVLDFPTNTLASRAWAKKIVERSGVAHCLHYLELSDEVCKARLRLRNEANNHEFNTNEDEFEQFSKYFVAPSAEEGLYIVKRSV
jgi:predicted kinase